MEKKQEEEFGENKSVIEECREIDGGIIIKPQDGKYICFNTGTLPDETENTIVVCAINRLTNASCINLLKHIKTPQTEIDIVEALGEGYSSYQAAKGIYKDYCIPKKGSDKAVEDCSESVYHHIVYNKPNNKIFMWKDFVLSVVYINSEKGGVALEVSKLYRAFENFYAGKKCNRPSCNYINEEIYNTIIDIINHCKTKNLTNASCIDLLDKSKVVDNIEQLEIDLVMALGSDYGSYGEIGNNTQEIVQYCFKKKLTNAICVGSILNPSQKIDGNNIIQTEIDIVEALGEGYSSYQAAKGIYKDNCILTEEGSDSVVEDCSYDDYLSDFSGKTNADWKRHVAAVVEVNKNKDITLDVKKLYNAFEEHFKKTPTSLKRDSIK